MRKKLFVCGILIYLISLGCISFVPSNGVVVSGTIKPSYYGLWNPGWISVHAVDFEIADDGYVYQIGSSDDYGFTENYTFHLVKWNPTANLVWNRTWDRSQHTQINGIALSSSFIYTAGWISSESVVKTLLVKWSSNGDILWSRTWNWTSKQRAWDVDVDLDGNVYVLCAIFDHNETATQLHLGLEVLLKYNADGTLLANYSGGYCVGRDMEMKMSENGLIYSLDPYYGGMKQWDTSGSVKWASVVPTFLFDVLSDGNYIVATEPGYTLRKFDANQNEIWNTTDSIGWEDYYGSLHSCGGIDTASNGSVYLYYKIRNETEPTMILDKFNADGNLVWNKTLRAPDTWDYEFTSVFSWVRGIAATDKGVLYLHAQYGDGDYYNLCIVVYGTPTPAIYQSDMFIIILVGIGIIGLVALVILVKRRHV